MKIREIYIRDFGFLSDYTLRDLSPGLTILQGSNEAGKTTIFEFILRMLYGFPDRRKKNFNYYDPITRNAPGGRLELTDDRGKAWRVSRFDGKKGEEFSFASGDDLERAPQELHDLLGRVPIDVYRDIFAIRLEDLGQPREETLKRIHGAGMGLTGKPVSGVLEGLNKKSEEIFKSPRSKKGKIREEIVRYREIREQLMEIDQARVRYEEATKDLEQILNQIGSLEKSIVEKKSKLVHLRTLKQVWPSWREMNEARESLESLPGMENFPERGLLQLEKILERKKEMKARHSRLEEENTQLEGVWKDLETRLSRYLTGDVIRDTDRNTIIPILEQKRERVGNLQTLLSSKKEKDHEKERVEEKRSSLQSQLMMSRMSVKAAPNRFRTLAAIGAFFLIALGIACLIFEWKIIGTISLILALIPLLYSVMKGGRKREEKDRFFSDMEREHRDLGKRIDELTREIGDLESEINKKSKEAGYLEIPDPSRLEESRDELGTLREALRSFLRDRGRIEIADRNMKSEQEEMQTGLEDLLGTGNAKDEEEFRRNAEVYDKRNRLEEKRATAARAIRNLAGEKADILIKELKEKNVVEIDASLSSHEESLKTLERERGELLSRKGALIQERKQLETGRIRELLMEKEQVLAELEELGIEWSRYALAIHILEQARKKYERERQPGVVRAAQHFFEKITDGKYRRIVFREEGERFSVIDEQGEEREPHLLSRGALEQLYLCLRLGLIRSCEESGIILPVLMDDVLVNFDPERARAAAAGLLDLCNTHQLLFLTCHPGTVALWKELNPGVRIINL